MAVSVIRAKEAILKTKTVQDLLTVKEVARELRLGRTRAYGLLWSGELRSLKIGRRRLVRRSDLERFLESHELEPGESGA
jgi:excisionase family DNA binding protein